MPFPSTPLTFIARAHVVRDVVTFQPSDLLLRYFPLAAADANAVPEIIGVRGSREMDPSWWRLDNLSGRSDERIFNLHFKGGDFSAALEREAADCHPSNRDLRRAFLDQDTIQLLVNMGSVAIHDPSGNVHTVTYQPSLLLKLAYRTPF